MTHLLGEWHGNVSKHHVFLGRSFARTSYIRLQPLSSTVQRTCRFETPNEEPMYSAKGTKLCLSENVEGIKTKHSKPFCLENNVPHENRHISESLSIHLWTQNFAACGTP